jgi:hypothetical protein
MAMEKSIVETRTIEKAQIVVWGSVKISLAAIRAIVRVVTILDWVMMGRKHACL